MNENFYDLPTLQVADYRKPEINLQVTLDQEEILTRGAVLMAALTPAISSMLPPAICLIQWALYATPQDYFHLPLAIRPVLLISAGCGAFNSPVLRRLGFGHPGCSGLFRNGLRMGILTLEFPTLPENTAVNPLLRQRYTLEVVAADESGLPVAARTSLVAHPAEFYIGLRPDNWIGQAQVDWL